MRTLMPPSWVSGVGLQFKTNITKQNKEKLLASASETKDVLPFTPSVLRGDIYFYGLRCLVP